MNGESIPWPVAAAFWIFASVAVVSAWRIWRDKKKR